MDPARDAECIARRQFWRPTPGEIEGGALAPEKVAVGLKKQLPATFMLCVAMRFWKKRMPLSVSLARAHRAGGCSTLTRRASEGDSVPRWRVGLRCGRIKHADLALPVSGDLPVMLMP